MDSDVSVRASQTQLSHKAFKPCKKDALIHKESLCIKEE